KSIASKYSGSQLLQKKYKEYEKSVRIEEIDGAKLVKNVAQNMEEIFRKKAEATRRLVEAAEEAHLQHEENPDLQYEYFNAVLINEVDEDGDSVELGGEFLLEPNDHFNNLSVNLSLSVVQVPTNMYNKDPDIVNGVYWSEALNKVFVDNFKRDPTLIWQYFGSAKGFFRQYPGVKWHPDEHGVIAFDCRNRKWYIQAATSPKDVVILVDVSGSMKGLRLTIARQTVASILDTLGDDDFFNIIAYNQEIHYVEPCLNGTLVQADSTNKDHFKEHLDKLFAKGIGLLGNALTEAFTILNEVGEDYQNSCSQAIMLITDGATQMYDDVFAKYNWPERKVRIFPYLIGRESAFADNLKWMACANKGFVPPQKNQGILLGVVGTDIPIQELMKTIPKHKLGIHGYAFAITNNGYILTHPDLRPLVRTDLRTAMVNRRTGTFSMEVKRTVDKGKRVLTMHNDYYFTDIKGTPFSVGVALSRGHGKYFFKGNVSLEAGEDLVYYVVQVIYYAIFCCCFRTYCNTDEHHENRHLTQVQAIKLYMTSRKPHLKCDRELIQQVLFDAVVTAPLEAYWTGLALNKSENSDKGVEIAFLGTRTGLSRTNLFVVPEQDFLTAEDKEGVFNADHFPLWYKRAAEQVPGTFVYSIPFRGENKSVVLASTAIQLLDDRKSPIVAAVGIQMKLEFFQRKFWTASRQDIKCYLIDNNGFILNYSTRVLNVVFMCAAQRAQRTMMVPCDTEYPAFVSERTIKETTGNTDCGGCIRTFVIQQIPSSNLFMVVVENKCDCSSAPPVTMEPIEIIYILFNKPKKHPHCDRLKFQKDRRRPQSCHPFHPEVHNARCMYY
uniref:Calcium channel, voltage dependent, alpha2/delta subunit 3 n=1 Tax=Cyprinus carpio TaxID=7962 RepID=A0A8C1VXM6_CYPCA